jgi:hypothetical protein
MLSSSIIESYIAQFKEQDKAFLPDLTASFPFHIDKSCYFDFQPNHRLVEYKGSELTGLEFIDSPVLFYDFLYEGTQLKLRFPPLHLVLTFVDRYKLMEKGLLFEKPKEDTVQRSYEYKFKEVEVTIPLKSESYLLFAEKVTFAIYDYLEEIIRDILSSHFG